jgi:hypothetical protein
MQGLPKEEKAEMFCLFESALKVVTAEDIGDLKQKVDEMARKYLFCSIIFINSNSNFIKLQLNCYNINWKHLNKK